MLFSALTLHFNLACGREFYVCATEGASGEADTVYDLAQKRFDGCAVVCRKLANRAGRIICKLGCADTRLEFIACAREAQAIKIAEGKMTCTGVAHGREYAGFIAISIEHSGWLHIGGKTGRRRFEASCFGCKVDALAHAYAGALEVCRRICAVAVKEAITEARIARRNV